MRKLFNTETLMGAIAVAVLAIALLAPTSSKSSYASDNSASGNSAPASSPAPVAEESYQPPAPRVDPAVEKNEQFVAELIEEGSKIENKSTSGVVSDAPGLYFTQEVTGVAIKASAGASLQ